MYVVTAEQVPSRSQAAAPEWEDGPASLAQIKFGGILGARRDEWVPFMSLRSRR